MEALHEDSMRVYHVVYSDDRVFSVRSRNPLRAIEHAKSMYRRFPVVEVLVWGSNGLEKLEGVL